MAVGISEPGAGRDTTDPRVLRSRKLLMDALEKLLTTKELEEISVQDIADEATLNRATFYLHFPDKNALLQAMSAARFRRLVERRGLSYSDCDTALRAIALGVCDYLSDTAGCPSQLTKLPLENSIIPVIEEMFREGNARHSISPGVDVDFLASTTAWAIYGAARTWLQSSNRIPAEEMAAKIESMVRPILRSAS